MMMMKLVCAAVNTVQCTEAEVQQSACMNGGSCLVLMTDNQRHLFCRFTASHCFWVLSYNWFWLLCLFLALRYICFTWGSFTACCWSQVTLTLKVRANIALPGVNPTSELRDVTCHMGLHSVTCHPTQVNTPHLTPAMQTGTWFTYPGGMEGWVDLVDMSLLNRSEFTALYSKYSCNVVMSPGKVKDGLFVNSFYWFLGVYLYCISTVLYDCFS